MPDYPHPSTLHTEAQIIAVRNSLPQAKMGEPLQAYKELLGRRLRTIRARGERETDRAELMALVDAHPDECPHCHADMTILVSKERYPSLTMRIVCYRCVHAS